MFSEKMVIQQTFPPPRTEKKTFVQAVGRCGCIAVLTNQAMSTSSCLKTANSGRRRFLCQPTEKVSDQDRSIPAMRTRRAG